MIEIIDMNNTSSAKVTLDHWRSLVAVVDEGGYAPAAESLGKSQSTVSHSIQRLEDSLGTAVLKIEGRRAVLTAVGEVALRRARLLLDEAADIERMARTLSAGVEAELHVAVDAIFPNQILLPALANFADAYPGTRVELVESVMSGTPDLVRHGRVQLAITPWVPQGFAWNLHAWRVRIIHSTTWAGRSLTVTCTSIGNWWFGTVASAAISRRVGWDLNNASRSAPWAPGYRRYARAWVLPGHRC
jgi:DNA-binding transcriptional LysR family regulator